MKNTISKITMIAAVSIVLASPIAWADEMKLKVISWDPATNELVLEGKQAVTIDTEEVDVPETLSAGDEITIVFDSAEEDTIDGIQSITIDDDE